MTLTAAATAPLLNSRITGKGGPRLVCIHELGGSMNSFAPLLPGLEPHCRVLRYDQRGHGGSFPVAQDYGMGDHADDLAQLLDAACLRAPYWLLGVAAGAAIAVAYAARYAEKVAGLLLFSPALSMDPSRAEGLRRRADAAIAHGMSAVVDDTLARSWPPQAGDDPAAAAGYRSHLLQTPPLSYALANRALAAYASAADLARLRCPVRLFAGRHDQVRPPAVVEALLRQLPQADYTVLPGAHLLPLQAPQAVLEQILKCFADLPPEEN
jgi:3-oxoadipate enol-lactonase